MKMANGQNWKEFVVMLCNLGVQNSSKEIASIINRNITGQSVSWQQVAGVRANLTKKSR
jgi:hypothetical protein